MPTTVIQMAFGRACSDISGIPKMPSIELIFQQISTKVIVKGFKVAYLKKLMEWRMRQQFGMLAVNMSVSSESEIENGNCKDT
jgi:hypothetical protein